MHTRPNQIIGVYQTRHYVAKLWQDCSEEGRRRDEEVE